MNRKYRNGCSSVAPQQWNTINKTKKFNLKESHGNKAYRTYSMNDGMSKFAIIIELNFGETTSAHFIRAC